MNDVQAGWAECEITPPLGLPMGGRGPQFTPGARVLDPLSAQAVVLRDAAGGRVLWVSLDLIGIGEAQAGPLRRDLAAAAGVSPDGVLLNFAHTHSGPMTIFERYIAVQPKPPALTDYEADLRQRLVQLAWAAARRLGPVAVT